MNTFASCAPILVFLATIIECFGSIVRHPLPYMLANEMYSGGCQGIFPNISHGRVAFQIGLPGFHSVLRGTEGVICYQGEKVRNML